MPVFRGRQEELKVLKSFDFGEDIYPCLEIIKEVDRKPPSPRKNAKKPSTPKKTKTFEEVYLPIINSINAKKIFVDLPVHLKMTRNTKPETLSFLRSVVSVRTNRTDYIKKLAPLAERVIPVISSYFPITGESGSIIMQESDLRSNFSTLAFRTFTDSFVTRDFLQIQKILRRSDFLILDWQDRDFEMDDDEKKIIVDHLKKCKCTVVIHRNAIPKELTNVGLEHEAIVSEIDNSLLEKFKDFEGDCFSDYAGIKKDDINKGGGISPGFVYYDAVKNIFYGYKGEIDKLETFETVIVPAVIKSPATRRMLADALDYLGHANIGWRIIENIHQQGESGKNAAKFKRIGMEHYLHCMKMKINGDSFN